MFLFKLEKTIQAVALLLRDNYLDQSSYLKLLKLLYIADRESLKETGRPITGDRAFAMEHGPVLSRVYDLIKGEDSRPEWAEHFAVDQDFRIQAIKDPGTDLLCDYEIQKLEEVSSRHKDMDRWQLRDLTHEFPEWEKNNPEKSSKLIPVEHILEAIGRAGDLAAIQRDAEAEVAFARTFRAKT